MPRGNTALDSTLDGQNTKPVGDRPAEGGIPILFRITTTTAAGTFDTLVKDKIRVIDAWAVKTTAAGGAGAVITVQNGATAITDAMDANIADQAIVRAGTINDAQHDVAAAGTLRVVTASGTDHAAEVYVLAIRVD